MERKDVYTMRELFDNLEITMTELVRRSSISDVTLGKIRRGQSARRDTINTLLRIFSEIYGIKFSVENVSGLMIQGKPAMETVSRIAEKAEKAIEEAKTRQAKVTAEKAEKRPYARKQDTSLPDGCILASKFATDHGIARPTFIDHMNNGLGPGLIGKSTDTIPERDHVDYSKREKRTRKDGTIEYERYLTQEQQHQALEFWKRHDVGFGECNDIGCWCHTVLKETE